MAALGPRMQKLRSKEIANIRGVRYKDPANIDYETFEKASPAQKVKILDVRPDIALGSSAGKEFDKIQFRIYLIIFASLIISILSTIAYKTYEEDNNMKEYLVASFSISWFLFVSFIFLLFNATRLMHIILFIVILSLLSIVHDHLEKRNESKNTQNIILATELFAGVVLIVLLYYYLTTRKEEELIELKDANNLRQFNNYTAELVKKAREEEKKKIKKELDLQYQEKLKFREQVYDKYIRPNKSAPKKKEDD